MDYMKYVQIEQSKYQRKYLENIIKDILREKCKKDDVIAFYGGGCGEKNIESLLPQGIFAKYVIDQNKVDVENHIFPEEVMDKTINCIIITAWYGRSDISYFLYKCGFRGDIIDIYEELKLKNIDLCQPFYKYTDENISNNRNNIVDYKNEKSDTIRVEFYLIDAFEIYHFYPLYKKLRECEIEVKFIAEPTNINISQAWFDFHTACKLLEIFNVEYGYICNPNAEYAITTQTNEILGKYRGKKIRYAYGNGMCKSAMSNSERVIYGFDYSLVAGIWRKNILKRYVKNQQILCMGYPKYLSFFANKPERSKVLQELGIETLKPILVYFPTWGVNSTIPKFAEYIGELRREYFVISKAHHCTFRLDSELNNLNILNSISDIVLEGNYDFAKAAILGDISICDAASGAATEVPYLNIDAGVIYVYDEQYGDAHERLFYEIFKIAPVVTEPQRLWEEVKNVRKYKSRESTLERIFGKRGINCLDTIAAIFK